MLGRMVRPIHGAYVRKEEDSLDLARVIKKLASQPALWLPHGEYGRRDDVTPNVPPQRKLVKFLYFFSFLCTL